METPDITRAQIVAIIQPIVTCAIAFGAPISETQSVALIGLAGAVSSALALGDAIIRNGRSRIEAARKADRPYDSYVDGE